VREALTGVARLLAAIRPALISEPIVTGKDFASNRASVTDKEQRLRPLDREKRIWNN